MCELSSNSLQLGSWTFNQIRLEDKKIYSEYIKASEYPANLWSSNFDYLWASSRSKNRKILWKIIDDMLITFAYSSKKTLYLMCLPFGSGDSDKVSTVLFNCLHYCCELNDNDISKSIVKTVNSMQLEFLRRSPIFEKQFKIIPLVGIEKHYSIQDLILLYGTQFRHVRQQINRFSRFYPNAILRKYTSKDYDAVIHLGNHWSNTAGKKYAEIFDTVYFREIVKYSSELNHHIFVVEIEGKIIGMISAGELPTGEAWGCLSKFMNEYEGLCEFMTVGIAHEINKIDPNINYLNTGSDLGSKGLRFFKDRFRPVLNLKRYGIKLR